MLLKLRKINDFIVKLTSIFAIIIMALITIVVGIQVFTRILLNNTVVWSEEVARMLTFWVVGLGASIGFRRGENMAVNFFIEKIPIKQRNYIELFLYLAIGYFLLIFLKTGLDYSISNLNHTTPILQIHYTYFSAIIPFSVTLMILYSIEKIIETVVNIKDDLVN